MTSWQTLRQLKGKSIQGYTQEFRKRELILGISLDSPKTLLKYIGGLQSYMRHTILMFNPTNIDEVSVQATHLEARRKNRNLKVGGSSQPTASKNKEKRKHKWKARKANTAQKSKSSCTHCKKDGHDDENCWILHSELRPKKFEGKKKKTAIAIQKDLGSDSGDETTIAAIGIKGSPYLYDRKAIFYRAESKYLLIKDGIEYFEKKPDKTNVFEGCDAKQEADLEKIVLEYDILFQEPKGLPPKKEIVREINLQQDAPLPNIGMYRLSTLDNVEIKKQVQEFLEKGFIRPRTSPCGSPIVLVRK
eukprot:PITA_10341